MINKLVRFVAAPDALDELPFVREFFNTMLLCVICVMMTFGAGMWFVMFLEKIAQALLGVTDPSLRTYLFEAHPNGLWAWEQLIGHGLDLVFGIFMLAAAIEIKPFSLTWLNRSRPRFGLVALVANVAIAYAIYRGVQYLTFDVLQVGAGEAAGPQVSRALLLTAFERMPMLFSTLVVSPILEELLFRGYVYNLFRTSLRHSWTRYVFLAELVAVALSAGLFTMLHAFGASPAGLLNILIGAVILTLLYRRTGSLLAPIALHCVFNGMIWYHLMNP